MLHKLWTLHKNVKSGKKYYLFSMIRHFYILSCISNFLVILREFYIFVKINFYMGTLPCFPQFRAANFEPYPILIHSLGSSVLVCMCRRDHLVSSQQV